MSPAATELAVRYFQALASETEAQRWAHAIRDQARNMGAFSGDTINARLERLFEIEANRLGAAAPGHGR